MGYEPWDVVLAAFPFSEIARTKLRPVVVLSSAHFNAQRGLVIVAMITTAAAGRWPSDQAIDDLVPAGLRHACVVRFKLATLALGLLDRRIGSLSAHDQDRIRRALAAVLPVLPKA